MIRRLLLFIACLCLPAAAQTSACTIGGTVVDSVSHQPLARARVVASGAYSLMQLTDDRGGFCFPALEPGHYEILVQKPGYLEGSHGVTLAVEKDTVVQPVTVRLTRAAAIAGTVCDAAGETLPGVEVTVWDRVRRKTGWGPDVRTQVDTDANGAFRFAGLPPGTYYLSVHHRDDHSFQRYAFAGSDGKPPAETEVETFYAGSFTFDGATPVVLEAGQQWNNLVLTFKKTRLRRITGRVGNPTPQLFLTFESSSEMDVEAQGAIPISKDGAFAKLDLLPVRYNLALYDGDRLIAHKEIDLTNGDARGITLDPIETMDVAVTFRTEGKGPAFRTGVPGQEPVVLERDGSDDALALQVASDGTYHFREVPQAIYRLSLNAGAQGLYVKSVRYGEETQTGDKVDLRSERPQGLEVTLSPNVARLDGRVVPSLGNADADESANLTVILLHADNSGADIVSEAGTDQKRRFEMTGLAPGRYRLLAIEDFDDDQWGSTELAAQLAAKSLEVELKENDRKKVSVTLIPAADWKAAVKKNGG